MEDRSRHSVAELARDLRCARQALGHDVGGPSSGPSRFRDAADVSAWFHTDRDRVLAVLREADAEAAAALLVDLWPVVPPDADDTWCRQLHDMSAGLSAALPTSPTLATAYRRGAEALRARGSNRLATSQGTLELAIHRQRDDDPDATAAALADLAVTYRLRRLPHEVVNCLDESLEVYLRHGDRRGVARSLTDLGATMLEAGRLDSALDHLIRADKAFADVTDPLRHSDCLVLLGRVRQLSGDDRAAHRAFNRALASLVGIDDAEARRVRDSVARLRPLPEERGDDQSDQQAGGEPAPRRRS